MNKVYVDGSGWSGVSCRYCIYFPERKEKENRIIKILYEEHTSNEMEYLAIIRALREVQSPHNIFTDSQLVYGQVALGWKVNYHHLLPLRDEAKELIEEKQCQLIWIPREKNMAGEIIEKQIRKLNSLRNSIHHPKFPRTRAWRDSYYGRIKR